ncbi:MAG TPA: endonuclease MutS2 [Candidatus Tectomicrobia bacterium]
MTQYLHEQVASEHALDVLEFGAIRRLLGRRMSSELGRSLLPTVLPLADLPLIHLKQRQTSEAKALLIQDNPPSLQHLVDPRPLLDQIAQQGKILEPPELLDLQFLLSTARQTKRFFGRVVEQYPLLAELTEPMLFPEAIDRRIGQVVDPRGDVKDSASPRLQEIRSELRNTRQRVRRRLDWHLTQHTEVVQEPLITLRNNRYVIPLKPDFQRLLRGIVHDHSSSGATVFVEPLDVLDLNNRLVELATAEGAEVHRILREITTEVWEAQTPIRQIAATLGEVDYILARARLSQMLDGHEPEFIDDGRIALIEARHPLLVEVALGSGGMIVPATLIVDPEIHTLVITGPNTGGKTVLLKTIGLLTLMAQAGLHITAKEGSALRLFRRVLVDIGDEQSIAQSLSTFSGHMQHIINFLHDADEHSLVLLDELGAGTDPAEGAALGIAVLEHLYCQGAKTFITTHHQAIKLHAHTHQAMDTAVMAFDTETLQPTFHVQVGHFGGSNAFAIGRRLGLPPAVLATAQTYLDADQHRLMEVADRLHSELRGLEQIRREVERNRSLAAQARTHYEAKVVEIDTERRFQLADAADEASRLLAEARRRLDEAIHQVRRQGIRPEVEPARELVRQVETELEQVAAQMSPPASDVGSVPVGGLVWLPKWRVRGVVLRWPEAGDLVEVQAGQMTLKVPTSQIEPLSQAEPQQPMPSSPRHYSRRHSVQDISPDLNIIGWRVTDAIPYLDKYLDEAVATSLHRVRIIHGKGSGRLRAAVHELLTSHPQVKAYMPCSPQEGGWGATLVELHV